jgi:hypothetical protein
MGCAGRVANGINTVHLSYVREKTGHALIGARQWIPAEDIADPVRSLVTGLPLDLRFRTKGQLAVDVLQDAYADGLSFDFACGVYGSCTGLRQFLEFGARQRERDHSRRILPDISRRRVRRGRHRHPSEPFPRPKSPG